MGTYLRAGHGHLNLAIGGADQGRELFRNFLDETKSVVRGKRRKEVLDCVGAGTGDASVLVQLRHDECLVVRRQSRGGDDIGELVVAADEPGEVREGLGGGVECRGLGCGSELEKKGQR